MFVFSYFIFFFLNVYGISRFFFFFQAEDGIRDLYVTGVQTCALPIWLPAVSSAWGSPWCSASPSALRGESATAGGADAQSTKLFYTSLSRVSQRTSVSTHSLARGAVRRLGKIQRGGRIALILASRPGPLPHTRP